MFDADMVGAGGFYTTQSFYDLRLHTGTIVEIGIVADRDRACTEDGSSYVIVVAKLDAGCRVRCVYNAIKIYPGISLVTITDLKRSGIIKIKNQVTRCAGRVDCRLITCLKRIFNIEPVPFEKGLRKYMR